LQGSSISVMAMAPFDPELIAIGFGAVSSYDLENNEVIMIISIQFIFDIIIVCWSLF
jgi:hypothetical protein